MENSMSSSLPVDRGVKAVMMAGLLRSMSLGGEIVGVASSEVSSWKV